MTDKRHDQQGQTTTDTPFSDNVQRGNDHKFYPWRVPASDEARSLCDFVRAAIEEHEGSPTHHTPTRKRARKKADQLIFVRIVNALVCNAVLYGGMMKTRSRGSGKGTTGTPPPSAATTFHISLSNRYLGSRYSHPVQSKTLPKIVKSMVDCGFLEEINRGNLGYFEPNRKPIQTTLRATPTLMTKADEFVGIDKAEEFHHHHYHFGGRDHTGEETIILKGRDAWADLETGEVKLAADAKMIPYPETTKTRRFRAEMETINKWLADAPLELDTEASGGGVDPSQRYLRRHFSLGDFRYGGRMFGGFWENLPKATRSKWITVAGSGEAVCTLDFGQTVVRLLYAMTTKQPPPPEGDCYHIPGFEDHRDGIKKMLTSAPFKNEKPSRFPAGVKALFHHQTKQTKVTEIVDAILQTHAPIAHLLFTDALIGHRMQHLESQIIIKVLLRIIHDTDIPVALPIHDALIVPVSRHQEARAIMQETFREECGSCMTIPVSVVM